VDDPLVTLADEIRACTACPLHRSARQAVPGEGSAESGILFLGEAPGYTEDVQGRPFVGVVRHRPPENRDPLPEEVAACHVWFERHLAALKPKVVVTLGRHAMYKFFPGESISRVHGHARKKDGITIFPVFHPAAALHQPSLRADLEKDFQALAKFLETTPRAPAPEPAKPAEKPAEQMTLLG
jgi:uracil-DNA glycosylase